MKEFFKFPRLCKYLMLLQRAVPVCDINLSLPQSESPSTSNRSTTCSLKRQMEEKEEQIKQLKNKLKDLLDNLRQENLINNDLPTFTSTRFSGLYLSIFENEDFNCGKKCDRRYCDDILEFTRMFHFLWPKACKFARKHLYPLDTSISRRKHSFQAIQVGQGSHLLR